MVSCGGSDTSSRSSPTPCPGVTPGGDASVLPGDIPFSEIGDVVSTEVSRGFLVVEMRSDLLVVEADPPIQRALLDAGYEILSHDNEGFEAEIFFSRGRDEVGTFTLRNLCEGQIRIRLVIGADRYETKKDG